MSVATATPRKSFLIALGLGSLPLMGFWLYGLFDLDEGYYAAVVAEMNRRHEWITPYFNGKPWFEKPILLYWFAKPSVIFFGQWFGPRLPSILATVGLLVLAGLYLKKRVNLDAGLWAMIMLGTSLLVLGIGRMMITDALLDLCIWGAFLSFYESLVGKRSWRLMTAFCLGLAVLAKGPVSLPLFIAVVIWTFVSEKELRPRFRGWWLLGILILFATISTWYVPAYLENGQVFIQKFLVEQNLQRFGGGDKAHAVPILLWPIYYPAILFVGLVPWSIWIPKLWWTALKGRWQPSARLEDAVSENQAEARSTSDTRLFERYLARWAAVIFVFFTISGTKLPHYILPAVPPLVMILAIDWARRRPISWPYAAPLSLGAFVLANVVFISWYRFAGFAELDADAVTINQMTTGKGTVLTYQLARVANGKGLALNDTSNPSLGFYLDTSRIEFEDTASLVELKQALKGVSGDVFVLTRPGRLSSADLDKLASAGDEFKRWPYMKVTAKYLLYQVVPNSQEIRIKTQPGREDVPVRIE